MINVPSVYGQDWDHMIAIAKKEVVKVSDAKHFRRLLTTEAELIPDNGHLALTDL